MFNVRNITTNELLLGMSVDKDTAVKYCARYTKKYKQYKFEVIKSKTMYAEWMPLELIV